MKILTAQEVKIKMEQQPDTKLIMTLRPEAFAKCHIPGSINIFDIETAINAIAIESEIIVYCSDMSCLASYYAYQQLERNGYQNIWRFAGGLTEWSQENLPLNESAQLTNES